MRLSAANNKRKWWWWWWWWWWHIGGHNKKTSNQIQWATIKIRKKTLQSLYNRVSFL